MSSTSHADNKPVDFLDTSRKQFKLKVLQAMFRRSILTLTFRFQVSFMMMALALLFAGCVTNVPVKTERPSKHFEMDYVKTHLQSTKRDIIEGLGPPGAIFQSNQDTYYVYEATGDLRSVAGIVIVVPPYFVPFFTAKGKDEALHCLALTFDEKGLLNDYRTTTGAEQVQGGVFVGFGPPVEIPLGKEETECVEALWNEEELQSLKPVRQEEEIRSLEAATTSDRLSLWAYSVFENTREGYDWLCRAANEGGTGSQIQLGDIFYANSHQSRENLIRAYVWYSLAKKDLNSEPETRLGIVEHILSHEELKEAKHRLEAWAPEQCEKELGAKDLVKVQQDKLSIEREVLAKDLKKRADEGDLDAQFELYIVNPKSEEGLRWLCTAADQGYVDARIMLGDLYSSRDRGPRYDPRWAYVWLSLAASEVGKKRVRYQLYAVRKSMNPKQLDEAENMLTHWKPGQCERDLVPTISGN